MACTVGGGRDSGLSGAGSGADSGTGAGGDTGGPDESEESGFAPEPGLFDVGAGDEPGEACGKIVATLRDFKTEHPDFQKFWGHEPNPGLVEPQLGEDGLPVFTGLATIPTQMSTKENFDQWYRDVPGVNQTFEFELELTPSGGGVYTFEDDFFFPLDGMGFGDEGNLDQFQQPHNFHFTTEIRTTFEYEPGQTFTFTGDDDVWVFIAGQIAIDLGGLHLPLTATVDLDTLGLSAGSSYEMIIFHAERRTQESNFRMDTTIDCLEPAG